MIKKSWWVDLRFNDARYRKKSPENSRAGAHAYETTLRQRLARGEDINRAPQVAQQSQSFEQFAWKWFDEYVVPNNKSSEQRAKKYILAASLVPFFGKCAVHKIAAYDVERYKAKLIKSGVTAKTVNNRLTIFRKCLVTAYEWLQLGGTPPKVTWLRTAPPKTDFLTPEETIRILSNSDGVVREMILTALRTGMRQGELKGLQWSSIDWQNRSVAVRHSRCDRTKTLGTPKSNRERHIPLAADLHEMLWQRKRDEGYVFVDSRGKPFDNTRLQRRLAKVCKRAGMRKIGWHTLRHTFASHLVMKGVPLTAVQMLLGHSTINMTMRYAHVAPSTLRAAIELLHPTLGQPAGNQWSEFQQRSAA